MRTDIAAPSMRMWRGLFAASAAAGAFSLVLVGPHSHAQNVSAAAASAPTTDTNTTSCQELKSRLRDSGTLTLVSGPRGWGDTYYARIPRCEFWQRPVFSFVTASDGWCGVGYICAAKVMGP